LESAIPKSAKRGSAKRESVKWEVIKRDSWNVPALHNYTAIANRFLAQCPLYRSLPIKESIIVYCGTSRTD
jgi:hypothetical protein